MLSSMNPNTVISLRKQPEDICSQILSLMQQLFEIRLIQKLSKPISMSDKTKFLEDFEQKFNLMHVKLGLIYQTHLKIGVSLKNHKMYNDEKTTKALSQNQMKAQIRKIETKYNDVFKEGSFKFYQKLVTIYHFPNKLQLIDIQSWSNAITKQQKYEKKKCKCCFG